MFWISSQLTNEPVAALFEATFNDSYILIIDEVHRLNKNIQDILLPHVENGTIILI